MQRISRFLYCLLCSLCLLLTTAAPGQAINFYTGGRLPEGFCLNVYPFLYTADRNTGADGRTEISDLGYEKYGVQFSGTYYVGDLILNAVVPLAHLRVEALDDSDSGLGDIHLRVGHFLKTRKVDILPVLAVKIPAGHFDRDDRVNLGDGQTDLLAELYLFKLFEKWSIDWVIKYSHRLRNRDIDFDPGDEFITEGVLTRKVAERWRLGPAVNFSIGGDNIVDGRKVEDSGAKRLSLGGEVFYDCSSRLKLTLSFLQDVDARNTTKGTLVVGRITLPFQ